MKKLLFTLLAAVVFMVAGMNVAFAGEKDKKETKNETVVYALSPAPFCQNCVNKIKGNLRFEKGVKNIDVDLKAKNVSITYSPKATSPEKLSDALKKIGYTAVPEECVSPAETVCPEVGCENCSGQQPCEACPVEQNCSACPGE